MILGELIQLQELEKFTKIIFRKMYSIIKI